MILRSYKYPLVIAATIAILGLLIVIDNPNNGNFVTVIALLVLGCGSILVETIHPIVAISLLGLIGFFAAVTIQGLVKWKKWLEAPIAWILMILIVFNTCGFIIWATGRAEGQW